MKKDLSIKVRGIFPVLQKLAYRFQLVNMEIFLEFNLLLSASWAVVIVQVSYLILKKSCLINQEFNPFVPDGIYVYHKCVKSPGT